MSQYIMHLDVNNAFLSWTAIYLLQKGYTEDIRLIPAIIGGDESKRHGVVLAKSNLAKQFGIKTGEPIYQAKKKCPQIRVFPTKYDLYKKESNQLYHLLLNYTDKIERFSIDECFIDFSDIVKTRKDFLNLAKEISVKIYKELFVTVNIGLSDDKILAKMASDFEKPNKIHTLYKDEIKAKMWGLPIEDLFMVGKKSATKLKNIGINHIGELAVHDKKEIIKRFGKFGSMIWNYSNGISQEKVIFKKELPKSIGNSITLSKDYNKIEDLNTILLSLAEVVGYRLRKYCLYTYTIGIQIKTSQFITYFHQKKLKNPTSSTQEIYKISKKLLLDSYCNQPIRLIGIKLDNLTNNQYSQFSLFESSEKIKDTSKLDYTIDNIKNRFGFESITLGSIMNINQDNITKKD